MTTYLTRDQILARKLSGNTEEVELDDGAVVLVRGITRGQAAELNGIDDPLTNEATGISFGLVEPAMTPDEVAEWITDEGHGYVQRVVDAIQRLSGSAPGQAKEYTKSVSRGRRARR